MDAQYPNVIVLLSGDKSAWLGQVVRSMIRAGIEQQKIYLLRCEFSYLCSACPDQELDRQLVNLLSKWVTIRRK